MKCKTNKIKKYAITVVAIMTALSSSAAICANAATEQYVHTVGVSTSAGSDAATWFTMSSNGTCTDTFDSYPTIFDNYTSSYNKSRVEDSNCKDMSGYKYFTLQNNSAAPVTVSYGSVSQGSRRLYYYHVSGGGFRDTVTTVKRY